MQGHSVSHSTTTNQIGLAAEGAGLNPLGLGEHDNKLVITFLAEQSRGLVTTKHLNVVPTTLPLFQSGIQAATTATNIQSTLLNDLRVVPSVQSSQE